MYVNLERDFYPTGLHISRDIISYFSNKLEWLTETVLMGILCGMEKIECCINCISSLPETENLSERNFFVASNVAQLRGYYNHQSPFFQV